MPWWAPLAGLTGAVAVFAGLALIDKMGAGLVNGLIITTNLLTSLAIDHFGLINMPVHALNIWRVMWGRIHDDWHRNHLMVLISTQDARSGDVPLDVEKREAGVAD